MTLSPDSARKLLESHDFMKSRIMEEYEKHDGRTYDEILFDVKEELRGEYIALVQSLQVSHDVVHVPRE